MAPGWMMTFPAPSLRELLSAAKLRECRPMVAPCPQFAHKPPAGSEICDRLQISKYIPHNVNHPSAGCFASGRVIFGFYAGEGILPFIGVLAKPQRCGRFSSPLRRLRNRFLLPFIGGHSLSHALWACQLPQRGSREGLCHSSYRPETARVRATFVAPTKL